MAIAILNVPLHNIADVVCIEQRHRMVMACMRLCFHDVVGELRPQQAGALSVMAVGFHATREVFEDAVAYLARQIGCGFIDLLYEDNTGGRRIGDSEVEYRRSAFALPGHCKLALAA